MDVRLVVSKPLADGKNIAADFDDEAIAVDRIEAIDERGFGGVDWTLIVELLGKGAVTGVGGLTAQIAAKQAWKALSTALKRIRKHADDERRRLYTTIEVPTEHGPLAFNVPTGIDEIDVAVNAIPDYLQTTPGTGPFLWIDDHWSPLA